jgi:oxidase EvaA
MIIPVNDTAQLRTMCEEHALHSKISSAKDGHPNWIIKNNQLLNKKADYFEISLYESEKGEPLILMSQEENALIMLLLADINGVPAALLSLRTEPGLIKLTNLSTTIQSTPSNYMRKHGGKATPFIEIAKDPQSFGDVIYNGKHYDWGNYYVCKTKQFLIVKLHSVVEAPAGYCWVELDTVRDLLLENHLITNDLRVTIPLISNSMKHETVDSTLQTSLGVDSQLKRLQFTENVTDARGTKIAYFRTETETREVSSWVQPLLIPGEPLEIRIVFCRLSSGRIFAVEKRTQPGLQNRRLWFPTESISGSYITQHVVTSAEGGRFWQYKINIKLQETESPEDVQEDLSIDVVWMTEKQLSELVTTPLQTSLELRMAWSLACNEK